MATTTGYRCPECGQGAAMHPWDEGIPECAGTRGSAHDIVQMERDVSLDGPLILPPPDQEITEPLIEDPPQ